MFPEIAGIGRSYSVCLGLGVAMGLAVTAGAARRARVPLGVRECVLLLACGIAGFAGAKLESTLERGGALLDLRAEITGGYRYFGGVIATALALVACRRLLGVRTRLPAMADVLMPSAAAAMVGVRLGCFLAGCCHGSVSSVPWAMAFPAGSDAWERHVSLGYLTADASGSLPVHPLQVYFALASLAVAGLGFWLLPFRRYEGQVALLCLALDASLKWALEGLRDPYAPHLQWIALLVVGATACIRAAMVVRQKARAVVINSVSESIARP